MSKKKVIKKAGNILSDSQMSKKYMGSGLASDITIVPDDALWLPSRNIYLNYTMGGGIPWGKILEVYGGESSGKSLLAKDFGSVVQALGGVLLWDDAEQCFDPRWAVANGLDLSKTYIYNETSIEKLSDWAADMAITHRNRLVNNEPILLVTDSIAALDCEANINGVQLDAKAEMGNRAKALYKYLRIRNQMFSELGITLIFINQLRKKVGAGLYEDPDTTPGGDAMKFFAAQRMAFFQKKQITRGKKEDKIWLGNEISVRMKKNKVAPPKPTFTTEIYFNEQYGKVGFNKYSNLSQMFLRTGIITQKTGKTGYWYDGEKIAKGKDALEELIQEDNKLRKKLLKKSNVNTVSKTRKQMEKLKEEGVNRYPVKIKKPKDEDDE